MKAQCVVIIDMLDLGKYTFAKALQRQRMQAPKNFPVGFLDLASQRRTRFGEDEILMLSKYPGSYAIEVAVAENFSYTGRNRILDAFHTSTGQKGVSNSSNNSKSPCFILQCSQ